MQGNEVIDLHGYQADRSETGSMPDELPVGTTLLQGQYTLTGYIASGGFGITYLAKDSLLRDVVIKECYPGALCTRVGRNVRVQKPGFKDDLAAMVEQFIAEARSLAILDHENIVSVHQIFKENQTAYMAIDYVDGPDLFELAEDRPQDLPPLELERLTAKILRAISYVHGRGMIHRDVSPDNILVGADGEPILIDFGAAHEQMDAENTSISRPRFVKDGYSPLEFYSTDGEQGPWSDLYSLGASLYHLITEEPPADAQRRAKAVEAGLDDPCAPIAGRAQGFTPAFLAAIDASLGIQPEDRIKTAEDWLGRLNPRARSEEERLVKSIAQIKSQVRHVKTASLPEVDEGRIRQTFISQTKWIASHLTPLKVGAVTTVLLISSTLAAYMIAKPRVAILSGEIAAPLDAPVAEPAVATAALSDTPVEARDVAPVVEEQPSPTEFAALVPDIRDVDVTGVPAAPTGQSPEDVVTPEAPVALLKGLDIEATAVPARIGTPDAPSETGLEATTEPAISVPAEPSSLIAAVIATDESGAPAQEPLPVNVELVAQWVGLPAPEALVADPENVATVVAARRSDSIAQPASEAAPRPDETAPAPLPDPVSAPAATQIVFSHWDVEMPFEATLERVRKANTATITAVSNTVDPDIAGTWIAEGAVIYAFNGEPLAQDTPLSVHVLNALSIDPDGFTRASVRYREPNDGKIDRGLLAVPVVRQIGLADGSILEARMKGLAWSVSVLSLGDAAKGDVAPGDILLRETTTGTPIDSHEALATALDALVARGIGTAEFATLRNGEERTATLQLAPEP